MMEIRVSQAKNGSWQAFTPNGQLILTRSTEEEALTDGRTVFNWWFYTTMMLPGLLDKATIKA